MHACQWQTETKQRSVSIFRVGFILVHAFCYSVPNSTGVNFGGLIELQVPNHVHVFEPWVGCGLEKLSLTLETATS